MLTNGIFRQGDSFQLFARNTPIMQRFQPQQPCNCLDRTAQALNCFPNISTTSSLDTHQMSLDEVLSIGTALVEHWELLHGCPVTETHLDARMLQTMINAVIKTLTLYEAAVGSILGGWGENQEPNGVGMDKSNNPPSTPNGSRDRLVETKPVVIVTEATAHLGNMQLDSHEMTIVAREALRHATMRLGEMLHDIEEDMSILRDDNHVGEVRQITSRLLRILGRINSNDGNMNEE